MRTLPVEFPTIQLANGLCMRYGAKPFHSQILLTRGPQPAPILPLHNCDEIVDLVNLSSTFAVFG